MKAVSWILLILGAFFALAGFLSIASDIQLGIAVTGLVTFSIAYQQLRLPMFKLIGWLSLIAGGLFFVLGLAAMASDIQLQVAASGLALAAAGIGGLTGQHRKGA
ncbi:MAG: hypothetical protein WBI99_01945 [Limnochordia bacterium]|jgi:hypothetical protein|nr:hypothetical protein [Limnochordia bacterium]NLO95864.1 hypothetical protein [Bacillota bacterium]HAI52470.1 hypothetical protein [Bacillota bacterium]HAN94710.1 hypothetical protein [Bacillota bacterium]HOB40160.1 hypothetical protein [Limnochordia bacterium]